MKLPGWKPAEEPGRFYTPDGENVSRRQYLNAQAQSVGWENYSQFQREIKQPYYSRVVAGSHDPREARKLDSDLSSYWAKNVVGRFKSGKGIGRDMREEIWDVADIDFESEVYQSYEENE